MLILLMSRRRSQVCVTVVVFLMQGEAQRLGQEHDRMSTVIASRDAELGKCAVEAASQKAELASLRAELADAQVRICQCTVCSLLP